METFATPSAAPSEGRAQPGGLAHRLRSETAAAHAAVEAALGLPGAIRDVADYRDWLLRVRALHAPLGRRLRAFPDWPSLGLDPAARCPLARLDGDLRRLGAGTPPDAPPQALPALEGFAQALGALYVLEGSALGGRVILRDLEGRLGPALAGATAFLSGPGPAAGALWQALRGALDLFGRRRPEEAEEVVRGALRTFRAAGAWMPLPARPGP